MDKTCSLSDCAKPHYAKGLCEADYIRARRNGGNPRPQRDRHGLSNVDTATRTGDCTKCGVGIPVIIRAGKGNECGRKPRRSGWRKKADVGMQKADYNAMREAQSGRCAICGETPARLCADHCHRTGVVRGLLCNACNFSIGRMKDDPERLRAAAAYLERSR